MNFIERRVFQIVKDLAKAYKTDGETFLDMCEIFTENDDGIHGIWCPETDTVPLYVLRCGDDIEFLLPSMVEKSTTK